MAGHHHQQQRFLFIYLLIFLGPRSSLRRSSGPKFVRLPLLQFGQPRTIFSASDHDFYDLHLHHCLILPSFHFDCDHLAEDTVCTYMNFIINFILKTIMILMLLVNYQIHLKKKKKPWNLAVVNFRGFRTRTDDIARELLKIDISSMVADLK